MTEETNVAFCWYTREAWEELKQIAPDADAMDDSYDEWRNNANAAIHDLRIPTAGQNVQKVQIKIDKLLAWCEQQGLANDSKARSRYAAVVLQQRDSKDTFKA